nr:type II secretion system protein F [Actinomyces sp. UMB0138]
MGVVVGFFLGVGIILVYLSQTTALPKRQKHNGKVAQLLKAAEIRNVSSTQYILACLGGGLAALILVAALTQTWIVALIIGLGVGGLPTFLLRLRSKRIQAARRAVWPDVIDDMISGISAGMSLPDTLIALGNKGPEVLRPYMEAFASDLAASGKFDEALTLLKERLADPVGDRIVEALRISHTVGGSDLSELLRSLAHLLREDSRTRGELEARQSWTVNGARLAVVAPWIVVALMCLEPSAAHAYQSAKGAAVLVAGALMSALAYWAMVKIAALPKDQRTLA